MKNLYQALTLRDLREGANIYCRLSASFWINYFGGLLVIFIGLAAIDRAYSAALFRHWSYAYQHPWLVVISIVIIVALLIPLLITTTRKIDLKFETRELKGKYSMLSSLHRLNRWIVMVATAVGVYLFARNRVEGTWPILVFLIVLLLSVLIAMAIYGWMARQFKDN